MSTRLEITAKGRAAVLQYRRRHRMRILWWVLRCWLGWHPAFPLYTTDDRVFWICCGRKTRQKGTPR